MIPGGTEKYVIRILRSLPKEKFRPFVIIDEKKGALIDELKKSVDEIIEIKNQTGFFNRVFYLAGLYDFFKKNKIDIVQAHNDISVFFVFLAAIFSRVRILIYSQRHSGWLQSKKSKSSHGFWPVQLKKAIIGFVSRNWADLILVNSRDTKKQICSDYDVVNSKIHVIHNCIEIIDLMEDGDLVNFKNKNNIPEDKIIIGVVASLTKRKNISLLIHVAKKLKNEKLCFIVIGEGPERNILEEAIEISDLNNIFHLLGEKKNVTDWVQSFDIAILPTLGEGFPNAILEYMTCGKPVISTDIDGVSEIVLHQKTGLLVSPNDKEELYDAIIKLIRTDGLRKILGDNGREHVRKEFRASKEIDRHIKIYEDSLIKCVV